MNQFELEKRASRLCVLLTELAKSDDSNKIYAADALHTLLPLFEKIDKGQIISPLKWEEIPCRGIFHSDAPLGQVKNVYSAYADFSVEITGGIPVELKKIVEDALAKRGDS
ncbi:hypothetical protein [Catenovulum sediminis]|uniref:hypothetical protein n=1 Tax=Catenovulum sediminis TaxID=1740262 RepID=UPI00117EEF99|nr:hypothetical protein [Catenovulum sediminis]